MSRFAELAECFDAAYITRQLVGLASPFAGFIFAMESYLSNTAVEIATRVVIVL